MSSYSIVCLLCSCFYQVDDWLNVMLNSIWLPCGFANLFLAWSQWIKLVTASSFPPSLPPSPHLPSTNPFLAWLTQESSTCLPNSASSCCSCPLTSCSTCMAEADEALPSKHNDVLPNDGLMVVWWLGQRNVRLVQPPKKPAANQNAGTWRFRGVGNWILQR